MRRNLEIAAIAALAVLVFIAVHAFVGPARLPAQIPTHVGPDGQPDAWGSSRSLLVLPAVALVIYLLMTVVARFPAAFNFPVRVTPVNRAALESVALNMIAWLKLEIVCLFAWIEHIAIQASREGQGSISPWFMPAALGVVFSTIGWHFVAMRRASRTASVPRGAGR